MSIIEGEIGRYESFRFIETWHVARQIGSSGFLPVVHGYPRGPGWTAAHVKRMAQKRRARAAHKRNCKGGR